MILTIFPGQLYVAASRVGSPDSLVFAVKKPLESAGIPFLTPNVVYREILLLSSQEMDTQATWSTWSPSTTTVIVSENMQRDTDYDGAYDGIPDNDNLEDSGEAPAPVEHRRRRLQGVHVTRSIVQSAEEQQSLAHPRDYNPVPPGPRIGWDEPLSEYEQIREKNMQVTEALNYHNNHYKKYF